MASIDINMLNRIFQSKKLGFYRKCLCFMYFIVIYESKTYNMKLNKLDQS